MTEFFPVNYKKFSLRTKNHNSLLNKMIELTMRSVM